MPVEQHNNPFKAQTFDGIDSCGERLAIEIKAKLNEHPSLQKISFVGHSMGGLLVRYAAGMLEKLCTDTHSFH